jgi:hypothetical protein
MSEKLFFTGTAHPAPNTISDPHFADLGAAEIYSANLGGQNLPLQREHEPGRVGNVISSWRNAKGELRVEAYVSDPGVAKEVQDGKLRELSLGTAVNLSNKPDGSRDIVNRCHQELSLCAQAARPHCLIDTINGKSCLAVATFSKKGNDIPLNIFSGCDFQVEPSHHG